MIALFLLNACLLFATSVTALPIPQLPVAFKASNFTYKTIAGTFRGDFFYDATKQSYRWDATGKVWGSTVKVYHLSRYDVDPPLDYQGDNFQPCKKSVAEPKFMPSFTILPGSKFMGCDKSSGVCNWQADHIISTIDWYASNATNAGKVTWVPRGLEIKVPLFGKVVNWKFDNVVAGLQPASVFVPISGCPPIVPPVHYNVTGYVRSAVTNTVLAGATVTLNQGSASNTMKTKTDSNGVYSFINVADGPSKLTAALSQYTDTTLSLNITSNIALGAGATLFLSPVLPATDMRFVLTWGYMPQDLDAHTWDGSCEIYYGNKQCTNGNLDHDTTTGWGPETITLQLTPSSSTPNTYHYFVKQYSSQGTLATSGARVVAYLGSKGKVLDLPIPTTQPSGATYWDVATVDAHTGAISVINKIQTAKPQ